MGRGEGGEKEALLAPGSEGMLRDGMLTAKQCEEVQSWTGTDIAAWLKTAGLEQYSENFAKNEITGPVLKSLTEEDLKEMGVEAIGHRKKLIELMFQLQSSIKATSRMGVIWEAAEMRTVTCFEFLYYVACGCCASPADRYKLTNLHLQIRKRQHIGPCGMCGKDEKMQNIELGNILDVDTHHHGNCCTCIMGEPDVVTVEFKPVKGSEQTHVQLLVGVGKGEDINKKIQVAIAQKK